MYGIAPSRFQAIKIVEAQTPILSADEWLARGDLDLPRQVVADYGDRYFISTILDMPFSEASDFLGFKGLMLSQCRNPDRLRHLLQRRLEHSQEAMQAWAATGIHGVYAQEVFAGADMISPRDYDQFGFAHNQPYFQHMSVLGLPPIHYACGDFSHSAPAAPG